MADNFNVFHWLENVAKCWPQAGIDIPFPANTVILRSASSTASS